MSLEGTYRVGHQEQLYIENNAMIAVPREDGGVAVHGSSSARTTSTRRSSGRSA